MYAMESPEHERRAVTEYMAAEAPDEAVEHLEKIATERVLGNEYFVWDVHTDKDRWWVVGPPTNLYTQQDFKSMDGILSFHIGLVARVMARDAVQAPDRPAPRLEKTRRQWEQAAEAQVAADEAEEFQAVGVRCRETLISFVHAMGTPELLPEGVAPPKASDFIHWSEHIANAVASGSSAARLRSYIKAQARQTWDYVSWLTHAKNASRADGEIAVQIVAHFLQILEEAVDRAERGGPDRCPSCGSYRVVGDSEFDFDAHTILRRRLCEACGWSQDYDPEPLGPPPSLPAVEEDCLPSSES